jgi:hypothetical protein
MGSSGRAPALLAIEAGNKDEEYATSSSVWMLGVQLHTAGRVRRAQEHLRLNPAVFVPAYQTAGGGSFVREVVCMKSLTRKSIRHRVVRHGSSR